MANNSDNPADPFKKALAEATKVMANNPELTINYCLLYTSPSPRDRG